MPLLNCREAEAAALGLDTSKETEGALSVHAPLAVAAWKGKGSINILVSKGMWYTDSTALAALYSHPQFRKHALMPIHSMQLLATVAC